jgi:hypothetical protein
VRGAEVLPEGAWEAYQWVTVRDDKSVGRYLGVDTKTELEYGVSNRFSISGAFNTHTIDTSGLSIDGYLPGPKHHVLKPSGFELEARYNILRPALDPIGLTTSFGFDFSRVDPHSGQAKTTVSGSLGLQLQKYFMEGRLVWVGNLGLEATGALRDPIANLPPGFDWPTTPEMEIEPSIGTGLVYRFAPSWYVGAEALYQTEFETEVGQERWSLFMGPSLHYGGRGWWATLTWFPQIIGGGEKFSGQAGGLHLIEKTRQEFRLKVAFEF